MAYIHDFERADTRHRRMSGSPTSNYEPWDNPTIVVNDSKQKSFFEKHLRQYVEIISWAR